MNEVSMVSEAHTKIIHLFRMVAILTVINVVAVGGNLWMVGAMHKDPVIIAGSPPPGHPPRAPQPPRRPTTPPAKVAVIR